MSIYTILIVIGAQLAHPVILRRSSLTLMQLLISQHLELGNLHSGLNWGQSMSRASRVKFQNLVSPMDGQPRRRLKTKTRKPLLAVIFAAFEAEAKYTCREVGH